MSLIRNAISRPFQAVSQLPALVRAAPYAWIIPGIISGGLLVLSFPTYSVWWLGFVGLVPFFAALFSATRLREVVWLGFSTMATFVLLGFGWVSFVAVQFGGLPWIVGQFVLAMFAVFGELQIFLFALLGFSLLKVSRRRKRWSPLLILLGLPVLYTGLDALYPKIFPNTLGHALYGWFALAQTAEFVGGFGLTFLLLLSNVALAVVVGSPKVLGRLWPGSDRAPQQSGLPRTSAVFVVLLVVAATVLGSRWGSQRIAEVDRLERSFSRSFRASVIQANVGDVDKLASEQGFEPAVHKVLEGYRTLTFQALAGKQKPDLLIWPETAYPFLYSHREDVNANRSGAARDWWIWYLVDQAQVPLYFGTYSMVGKRDYNSAFLVEPGGKLAGVYRKSILLAFGEYVPLGPFGGLIQDIVPTIADFGRGPGPMVIDFRGFKLGPQICYEGIVPEFSRGSILKGAELLLNITNDSWFGDTTEPWLHLMLTAFRSIELRRPMIRATNTGVSVVIGVTGRITQSTPLFQATVLDAVVPLPGEGQEFPGTFILKHGDVFSSVCIAFAVALLALLALELRWFTWVRSRIFSRTKNPRPN